MRRLLCSLFVIAAAAAAQPGFKPLFNGRDLDGWQVDTPGLWQVRDGALVLNGFHLAYTRYTSQH